MALSRRPIRTYQDDGKIVHPCRWCDDDWKQRRLSLFSGRMTVSTNLELTNQKKPRQHILFTPTINLAQGAYISVFVSSSIMDYEEIYIPPFVREDCFVRVYFKIRDANSLETEFLMIQYTYKVKAQRQIRGRILLNQG